jgi:enoyl-CoA hydratase/carnithine racemase
MRVRVLVSFASQDGGHAAGEVFDGSPADAAEWLRVGLVERMDPPVEQAMRQAPETAVTRRGRR